MRKNILLLGNQIESLRLLYLLRNRAEIYTTEPVCSITDKGVNEDPENINSDMTCKNFELYELALKKLAQRLSKRMSPEHQSSKEKEQKC